MQESFWYLDVCYLWGWEGVCLILILIGWLFCLRFARRFYRAQSWTLSRDIIWYDDEGRKASRRRRLPSTVFFFFFPFFVQCSPPLYNFYFVFTSYGWCAFNGSSVLFFFPGNLMAHQDDQLRSLRNLFTYTIRYLFCSGLLAFLSYSDVCLFVHDMIVCIYEEVWIVYGRKTCT